MSGVTPTIVLAPGADNNGFALMVSELVRQNLEDRPEKKKTFRRLTGRIAIVIEDVGVTVTLVCSGGHAVVHDGVVGIPDLTIRASSEDITRMSLIELVPRIGVPNPRGKVAKEIAQAQRDGRIRVYGGVPNLLTMLRLTRILSVN